MVSRQPAIALLLAFCLLFGQWAAGVHALSHLPPLQAGAQSLAAPDGDGRGASHVCLECLTGQALDLAVPVATLALAGATARPAAAVPAAEPAVAKVWRLPRSRAPPPYL